MRMLSAYDFNNRTVTYMAAVKASWIKVSLKGHHWCNNSNDKRTATS